MLFCSLMQTREHNQSFHRHKQTSHTVIIFVCKIIIIIDGRYYKAVLFFWLTHSVYYFYSKAISINGILCIFIYIYKYVNVLKYIFKCMLYICNIFGLGRPLSIFPNFQPPCKRKDGKKNHKAFMQ